jgi:FdhD protein
LNRDEAPVVKESTSPELNGEAAAHSVGVEILRCQCGSDPQAQAASLAREEPLEIRVRGRSVAVTMRTPGQDEELAAGFLLTEGMIHDPGDVVAIAPCLASAVPENTLNVFLRPAVEIDFEQLTRHHFASSSCGVCG